LQPEGRGVFAAVQLWPVIFAALAWLGANYSLAVRVAKEPEDLLPMARTAVALAILSSVVFVAPTWWILPWLLPPDQQVIMHLSRFYLAIFLPINVLLAYLQALDQGAGRLGPFNAVRHFLSIIYVLIIVGFWLAGIREVAWIAGALLVANFSTLLLRIHLTGWSCLRPDFNPQRLTSVVKQGAPFLASSAVYLAKDNIERLLLLFLLGPMQLGWYVVAFTSSGLHTTLTKSVNVLILSRSGALESEHAARDTARIFRVMSAVSAVLSVGMAAILPLLIPLMFGRSFQPAVIPAIVLVAAQYFSGQGAIIDEGLRAQSRPAVGLSAGLISMTVFAAGALLLARTHGIVGVALASVGSQITYCLVLGFYLRRCFQTELLPSTADFRFIRQNLNSVFAKAMRTLPTRP
jgi:O-antigen/teichoic acid export membrane protein